MYMEKRRKFVSKHKKITQHDHRLYTLNIKTKIIIIIVGVGIGDNNV